MILISRADGICIVGAACRLPGAPDERSFRDVLNRGLFTVGASPDDRWGPDLLFHPHIRAPGSAYTFAGGYLPAPYDFDIGVFGMSPREAIQVDPQQRLLAEVVWEALEDARIPPASLAGTEVGVYVGVSALDHANLFGGDQGAIESHFMTGNTLSIVANRVSYLFDLKGPSFVVDTACSSSLVAIDRAVSDLRSGRIDTAIVGGVNMLLSPAAFVGFSRASMLSPTGVCRPFSDRADGYVRSEGAVVFVLRRQEVAVPGSVRAMIVGSAVNSDGRTSGIALPGIGGQRALLERAYDDAGIAPDQLTFIEAHGTGTAVGDPIEAIALGDVLGRRRTQPLPIGSVKSNIGHLEPASGVAGMMKSLIALEQRRLPATLHLDRLNPHISFDALGLQPARDSIALGKGPLHCGISSFGFGGTNAHVILGSAPKPRKRVASAVTPPDALVVSAHCKDALAGLARAYADRLEAGDSPQKLATAALTGRALMRKRAVVPIGEGTEMADALRSFATTGRHALITTGTALPGPPLVCFVYNGNGSQWAGMGRQAYATNERFAEAFDEVDDAFQAHGIDRLAELLFADNLADRLSSAACAQPLIFATQVAITAGLADQGLRPQMVLGHSVGEIAAAHAAGILDLRDAARILAARARSQEAVRGSGGMAVLAADRATVARLIEECGLSELCIAADNAPSSVTISGGDESLAAFLKDMRQRRIAARQLDIDYPYHSPLLETIRGRFLSEAGILSSRRPDISMISTVTGEAVGEKRLESHYWWQNIRSEVLFRRAVRTAAEQGANLFVEIGARSILTSSIAGSIEETGLTGRVVHSLSESDAERPDPIAATLARAVANGFAPHAEQAKTCAVDRSVVLPRYPWQRQTYRYAPTSSAVDIHGIKPRHPLIGARIAQGTPEWRSVLDAQLVPYLGDHVLGGEVVVPATALAEMALAVARELWPSGPVSVEDLDIVQAMVLPAEGQREVSVRYGEASGTVEIYSRLRFGGDDWVLCARGRVAPAEASNAPPPGIGDGLIAHGNKELIYRKAGESGIDYGTAFRLFESLRRDDEEVIEVSLGLPEGSVGSFTRTQILHPATLDAAFHGLFDLLDTDDATMTAWLPIRFERLSVWQDQAQVTSATIVVDKSGEQLKTVSLWLRDAAGTVVARLDRALLRAVTLAQKLQRQRLFHLAQKPAGLATQPGELLARVEAHFERYSVPEEPEGWLLLRAHMRAAAHGALLGFAEPDGTLDLTALRDRTQATPQAQQVIAALVVELGAAGLLKERGQKARLSQDPGLPDPQMILATFAAEHPLASTDLALAAHAAATLPLLLDQGEVSAPRASLLERNDSTSLTVERACEAVLSCLDALGSVDPEERLHVVVAEQSGAALIAALAERSATGSLRLSVAAEDEAGAERLSRRLTASAGVEIINLAKTQMPAADVALLLSGLPSGDLTATTASGLMNLLRPDGVLLAAQLGEDNLVTFHRGGQVAAAVQPASGGQIRTILETDGTFSAPVVFGEEPSDLVVYAASRQGGIASPGHRLSALCIVHPSSTSGARLSRLAAALEKEGVNCLVLNGALTPPSAQISNNIFYLIDVVEREEDLTEVLSALQGLFGRLRPNQERPRVWIAVIADSADGAASVSAIRAFVRVAMNERSDRDIRFVEIDRDVGHEGMGRAIANLIFAAGNERELHLGRSGRRVARIDVGLPQGTPSAGSRPSSKLHFPRPGMLENCQWIEAERRRPGPLEIEVEVAATGLNFRDVMLALGLLNDDVLDEGLAGAVHGLECSGRIVSVGSAVVRHKVGDQVVGFGMNSFASHVVGPQDSFVPIPRGLSAETAAGIPVAFTTAWYALVELARVAPGERVLIHGGAGGVGLAAIQIASLIGAEVIATVSGADKEAIARLYGAAHVYDSRSLAFVDAIRDVHDGVDIVINSLAGDAMRGSIRCLRPRGRFVELGKRDYVANSLIGLRPFRRNLSYFGVDLDQLLALDPAVVTRGLKATFEGFADGSYLPLPTTAYRAAEAGEAFRMMQAAGHIGKIVVMPQRADKLTDSSAPPFVPGAGVQLVVGGTRGFGLATALWLAEQGAKHIVVASRSGKLDPTWHAPVAGARLKGVQFVVERVDITDATDTESLIARLTAAYGPISGIYHTAVTLNDGLIDTLTDETLEQVLAPKVRGASNLDRATRGQPIEQFVMYSSAAAFIGNPGQAAYAAANGYLEGLARRRRAEGLPALAVAWGAISDVGLLAERPDTVENLARLTGMTAMTANEALDELGLMLGVADCLADPVVTCAEFGPAAATNALPVLKSPAFAGLFASHNAAAVEGGTGLAELVADKSDAEALRIVTALVLEEVAKILRLAAKDVDLDASVDSLGMDSLMALELRMSIETRHRVELPVMAISAVGTLRELAHRILITVRQSGGASAAPVSDAESALLAMHGGSIQVAARSSPKLHSGSTH